MVRKVAIAVLSAALISGGLNVSPAAAAKISNGVACSKAGATTTVSGFRYRCARNTMVKNSKLTWLSTECLTAITQYNAAVKARKSVGTLTKALVVANPVEKEMGKARHDEILASGLAKAEKEGITGKAVTPFLLEHFHTASEGESLKVNIEIIKSNSALAADIAVAVAK